MRPIITVMITLLVLLCSFITWASGPVTRFERLSIIDGLSQNTINTILQDSKGFLWVGTQDGLNRYNGYEFSIFRHDAQNNHSISNNFITALYEDKQGTLWIGTSGGGLNRYNPQTQHFSHFIHSPDNTNSLSHNTINAIHEDQQGILWLGTDGGLNRYNEATGQFKHFRHNPADPNSLSNDMVGPILQDSQGILWIGTENGINRFNATTQRFEHLKHQQDDPHSLSHNDVLAIHEDINGLIWVGTRGGGLNRFDQQKQRFEHFRHQPDNPNSLSHDGVITIEEDSSGTLWIGTDGGGLNRFDNHRQNFSRFVHSPSDPTSISNDTIWAIHEDHQGTLWVGSKTGGLNRYNRQTAAFMHFKHQPDDPHSLSHNNVRSVYQRGRGPLWVGSQSGLNRYDPNTEGFEHFTADASKPGSLSHPYISSLRQDSQGLLWIGTFGGLNYFDSKTERFGHYKHQPNNPHSLSHDRVTVIHETAQNVLWFGTLRGGLNRFDRKSQQFTRFKHQPSDRHSLSSNVIRAISEDLRGSLWIATHGGGLNRYDPQTERFRHFRADSTNPNSLSHDNIRSVYHDRKGVLWVGTDGGLNRYDADTDHFNHYKEKDGLPNDVVYGIVEDKSGWLWLSTNRGIAHFNPVTERFKNYDSTDGLQSNEFNTGSYFQNTSGELFFGGINGFNRFFPENIKLDNHPPAVVLTDFLLANQSVPVAVAASPNEQTPFSLTHVIDALPHLTLNYQQNLMSFEFAALNLTSAIKSRYAYRLEGWDKDWIFTDAKNRRATYTNIPPGDYLLHIKASNNSGDWHERDKPLTITLLPPPWKTWWAYLIYALSAVGLMVAFVHGQRKKVQFERSINLRLTQVDKLKDEFLANTSHELRTPLNGIIGLAESLMDGATGPLPEQTNKNLAMVVASGKRLSNLVNDILDFSKLRNHNLTLHTKPVDLYSMAEIVLTLSRPLLGNKQSDGKKAATKNLELINAVPVDLPAVQADENRLQQILYNLVGNAIKFSDSGEVTVKAVATDNSLTISVTDTGIGIVKNQFATIFNSFEQLDGQIERTCKGTGLGLAVTKQLVELHGGTISVESKPGQGSTFSFVLPMANEAALTDSNQNQVIARLHLLEEDNETIPAVEYHHAKQFRLLLVDDEPVNRQVLHNHLSMQNYQLAEAADGEEALKMVAEQGPFDLILLDIMMPRLSGYEVCSQLRETWSASELPVIFLTAKNQISDLVQSFAVGANDYLCKPVSKHELLIRVESHLKFLDINRHLESKVAERTEILEQQKQQIIASQQQLIHAEKMASLGTLTAGVAHEINNPTNFVQLSVQNLEVGLSRFQQYLFDLASDEADESILESFRAKFKPLYNQLLTIKDGTERIKTIVRHLRVFSQLDAAEQKNVQITDLLQSTISLLQTKYLEVAKFVTVFTDSPELYCYPAQLNQVFMNLIVNACDAIQNKQQQQNSRVQGQVVVGCRLINDIIHISIKDDGAGMTEQTCERLFEPFYTTKEVGEGTGLGLSISFGIVQKHGGEITVESELEVGSELLVKLPCKRVEARRKRNQDILPEVMDRRLATSDRRRGG